MNDYINVIKMLLVARVNYEALTVHSTDDDYTDINVDIYDADANKIVRFFFYENGSFKSFAVIDGDEEG